MRVIKAVKEMQQWAEQARLSRERIAFVPTMGYLHEGHLSLMREGRKRGSKLVVSIFVNPTQFGPNEDFATYPRDFVRDCGLMETIPVDVVFAPEAAELYPQGFQTWVEAVEITKGMCGAFRPGHFRGVTTIVAKLFNIVKPHVAIFGEKDYQQLRTVERMVQDLNFDVEIVGMPTVREPDGLAMSSRNTYLSSSERQTALALSRALNAARERFFQGANTVEEVLEEARRILEEERAIRLEYLVVADAKTLEPIRELDRPAVIAVAAWVGKTRLIDNVVLARPEASGKNG